MATDIGKFVNSYTTFSGADIVCTFAGVPIGSLQAIMWSITREKAPIYTMGSANPRSFSRGKRGIAGTLMFTLFDRPGLHKMLALADENEIRYYTRAHNKLPGRSATRNSHQGVVPAVSQTTEVVTSLPYYADQIPPFDITITFLNEYGQAASRALYGVEIINEGSGASMDDITIEETMTFVARDCGPMIPTETEVNGTPTGSFTELDKEFGSGDFEGVYTPPLSFGNGG